MKIHKFSAASFPLFGGEFTRFFFCFKHRQQKALVSFSSIWMWVIKGIFLQTTTNSFGTFFPRNFSDAFFPSSTRKSRGNIRVECKEIIHGMRRSAAAAAATHLELMRALECYFPSTLFPLGGEKKADFSPTTAEKQRKDPLIFSASALESLFALNSLFTLIMSVCLVNVHFRSDVKMWKMFARLNDVISLQFKCYLIRH